MSTVNPKRMALTGERGFNLDYYGNEEMSASEKMMSLERQNQNNNTKVTMLERELNTKSNNLAQLERDLRKQVKITEQAELDLKNAEVKV